MKIEYDSETDTLTIEGINYSGAMFRLLGSSAIAPVGSLVQIIKRDDGNLTLRSWGRGIAAEDWSN